MRSDTEQPDHVSAGARSPADLSLARRMLAALRDGADLRKRKIRRLRAAVRAARYENALKFQVALDRLKEDVAAGE